MLSTSKINEEDLRLWYDDASYGRVGNSRIWNQN